MLDACLMRGKRIKAFGAGMYERREMRETRGKGNGKDRKRARITFEIGREVGQSVQGQ